MTRNVKALAVVASVLLLESCASMRQTSPARSAAEELLISTAADRAAEALVKQIPPGLYIYVDGSGFAAEDAPYGLATIQDQLLRHGDRIATDKKNAQAIILPRTGVLATDEHSQLLGVPPFAVPFFPVGNFFSIPEVDFYKRSQAQGVAKFAATLFDAKTGKLIVSTDPQYGFSHRSDWIVLLFFSWSNSDLTPDLPRHTPAR